MICSSFDLRRTDWIVWGRGRGAFAGTHVKTLREQLGQLFCVLKCQSLFFFAVLIILFLLSSGCFHNSPTLPLLILSYVWLHFSCNHIGFCCCFSLIGFTGMNADCCSPKCIWTASHHGFPRHQKLPANFLPFISHSFGVCSTGVQCLRSSFISAGL